MPLRKLKASLTRLKNKLFELRADEKTIAIFGTGNTTTLYTECFKAEGIRPSFFLDNNPSKWNVEYERGIPIVPPDSIKGRNDLLVLICSAQFKVQRAIAKQLDELGVAHLNVDEYVFARRADEIMQCAEMFEDARSIQVYSEVLEARLTSRMPSTEVFDQLKYFALPPFYAFDTGEHFVECGAYVGETIEQYLVLHCGAFGKITAFDPDKRNFAALCARVERLNREWALDDGKIELVNAGVGRRSETKFIHRSANNIGGSIADEGDEAVKIVALDDYFADQRIDFLKADIESYELNMLEGAERIIRRDRPKLAITIYHNASDMYRIQLRLARLGLGYKFAVRHHQPHLYDTVLYAWQQEV